MQRIIILCVLASLAAGAVIPEEAQANIVNYKNTNDGAGNYDFSYETSNGIIRQESGRVVNVGKEDEHIVVTGSYTYRDTDGKIVLVNYKADENGYQIGTPQQYPEISVISAVPGNVVASLLGK